MDRENWQRIKDHFAAASVLAAGERAAYLDENCNGDAALRRDLESLLAAHAEVNAVIDQPALAYVNDAVLWTSPEQRIGMRLGPYEIVALLGHGGMGEVYRARRVDAQYEKEVAIKLVPGGFQASFVLERMRAERQILANLEHPNIARLLDGGASREGTPYLVMELVEGLPLDRFCADRPLEQRLALFRDVCAAVSYAHQRLVVHRDLKPGNILVTADGTVKLLDFGIAKLLQPSGTDSQPVATLVQTLTPGFASPEQILGKPITTASDVYSLGVVLYTLLAGRSPYRGELKSTQDAIREICEVVPQPPGVVAGSASPPLRIPRDLDAIVMRALRKEPEKRYASVAELSEDLRRYLTGMPVRARGEEFNYRAGKFLRRHKLEVGAAALVFVALLGGMFFALREARIAEGHRLAAEAERARAERHFAGVRKLADTFLFDVHDAIQPLPGSTKARELLVNTGVTYLDTLAKEAKGDPGLQFDLGSAYYRLASIQGQPSAPNLGKPVEAMENYGKAATLLLGVPAGHPKRVEATDLAVYSYAQQAMLAYLDGDARRALDRTSKMLPIVKDDLALTDDALKRRLPKVYFLHAFMLDMSGEMEASKEFGAKSIALAEELAKRHPGELKYSRDLAVVYNMVGLTWLGKEPDPVALDESIDMFRKALAINSGLLEQTRDEDIESLAGVMASYGNLGNRLYVKGDYRAALGMFRKAEPLDAKLNSDVSDINAQVTRAQLRWSIGRTELALGNIATARRTLEENVALLEKLDTQLDSLDVRLTLASCEQALGTVHSQLALAAGGHSREALQEWRDSELWYARAVPRFEKITRGVVFDYADNAVVIEANAGLARARAALGKT